MRCITRPSAGDRSTSGHSGADATTLATPRGGQRRTQRIESGANGDKCEWLENVHGLRYPSYPEADMALCCLLAFWTNRVGRPAVRQSGLMHEKWDEVHYADGSTYGDKTIERAIAITSQFYDPDAGDDTAYSHDAPDGVTTGETPDDADRSRACLPKSRLLSERVDELEATLEQRTDRIETLEAEVERLTDELAARDRGTEQSHEEESDTTREPDDNSEPSSVLSRLFSGRSE